MVCCYLELELAPCWAPLFNFKFLFIYKNFIYLKFSKIIRILSGIFELGLTNFILSLQLIQILLNFNLYTILFNKINKTVQMYSFCYFDYFL